MPDIIRKIAMLIVSTLAIWFGVGMVDAAIGGDMTMTAAILAFLGTMALWLVFGLSQIGLITQTTARSEKAKRQSTSDSADERLALMLSLMTPNERDELKARLADELQADGEALPLADLLAEQDRFVDRGQF